MSRAGSLAAPPAPPLISAPSARAVAFPLAGALGTGLLLVAVFPSPDLGALAWVALVPLLLAIRRAPPARAFLLGWLAGLLGYGGVLGWIRLFGVPAWVAVSVAMGAYLGIFAAGAATLVRHYDRGAGRAWLWVAPLTWTAVEIVRSVGPLGFPWALLGLTQHRAPGVLPVAAVVGVWGLGLAIALANALVAEVLAARRPSRGLLVTAAVLAVLIAAPAALPRPVAQTTRIVAAVQPNVPPQTRVDPAGAPSLLDTLLDLANDARTAGAEVVVYPESALPPDLGRIAAARTMLASAAGGAAVVVGVALPGPQNAAVVLDDVGRTTGRYAKRRLVPFGEAGLLPGRDAEVVPTAAGRIALAICYESAFSDLIRPLARDADLLAILTNDGWFGASAGPPQHAAHSVLRAVETGRPVVRAANTGTSMIVRGDGTVIAAQPLGTRGVIAAAVPVGRPPTPYVRWGWALAPAAVAAWLLAAAPLVWPVLTRRPADALRLAAAVLVPGLVVVGSRLVAPNGPDQPLPAAIALLVAAALVGRGRLVAPRGLAPSLAISLGLTALLLVAAQVAYRRYGFDLSLRPADGAWVSWAAIQTVRGVAVEAWLRGAVLGAALPVGGWPLALVLPALLGVAFAAGGPQELVFWHLFTGVAYGALRLWTRDAVGLGPARGLGDAVLARLAYLR